MSSPDSGAAQIQAFTLESASAQTNASEVAQLQINPAEANATPRATDPGIALNQTVTPDGNAGTDTSNFDVREQLFNDHQTGAVTEVSTRLEEVTSIRSMMTDLDTDLLRDENPHFPPADTPRDFLDRIRPVLQRHPIFRNAEVRDSGRGLHLLIHLQPSVELRSKDDQIRWNAYSRILQGTLPSDPAAPGINALTRAVGSINSKNGRVVSILQEGKPVRPEDVAEYCKRVAKAKFKEIVGVLFGGRDVVSPCPLCRKPGSRMHVRDCHGVCYCRRGRPITLDDLMNLLTQNK